MVKFSKIQENKVSPLHTDRKPIRDGKVQQERRTIGSITNGSQAERLHACGTQLLADFYAAALRGHLRCNLRRKKRDKREGEGEEN